MSFSIDDAGSFLAGIITGYLFLFIVVALIEDFCPRLSRRINEKTIERIKQEESENDEWSGP